MCVSFRALIQEIIDQPGWAANNALVLMLRPLDAASNDSNRTAESWDGDANLAPLLTVDYRPVPEPTSVALLILGCLLVSATQARRAWRRA